MPRTKRSTRARLRAAAAIVVALGLGAVAARHRLQLGAWWDSRHPGAEAPWVEVQVTIPEGLRKEEVAAILADAGLSSLPALLITMSDPALARQLGVPDDVPGGIEGYLFPDTYRFKSSATPTDIVLRLRARLDELIDAPMKARMAEMKMDLHAVLTLAAIIEKETADPDERPRISAVFHNRLQRGMRLQTDPTVMYGVTPLRSDAHDEDGIHRADLRRAHPYNTYVIDGLPPGPIAQPGLASIKAALWPASSQDLFFVAKGASGQHEFCPTLACHNAAVKKWQLAARRRR